MKGILLAIIGFLTFGSGAMANPADLHPRFPIVIGTYQLTDEWEITLLKPHNRRIEDGAMFLWRPTFTVRLHVLNNPEGEKSENLFAWWRFRISPDAVDIFEQIKTNPLRLSYRLQEKRDTGIVYELNGFVIGPESHVMISIYFDDESQISEAKEVFKSLVLSPNKVLKSTAPLRGPAA